MDEVFPTRAGFAKFPPDWGAAKAGICPPRAWFSFMEGSYPDYPLDAIESTQDAMGRSLERLADDDSDPETRHCYHFQNLNPVLPEALVQMAMGTPSALYNGGLLQAHLRYFDPEKKRPGLPEHIAALVEGVSADSARVVLVNTDPVAGHSVIVQAGSFGEHLFECAEMENGEIVEIGERWLRVELGPSAHIRLKLHMRRFAHQPSYNGPAW